MLFRLLATGATSLLLLGITGCDQSGTMKSSDEVNTVASQPESSAEPSNHLSIPAAETTPEVNQAAPSEPVKSHEQDDSASNEPANAEKMLEKAIAQIDEFMASPNIDDETLKSLKEAREKTKAMIKELSNREKGS